MEPIREVCCGTTCDKVVMERQHKLEGAGEFLAYLEDNLTEDCSSGAMLALLLEYEAQLQ